MPRVCPKCQFVSPVDSPFCPACGAAMDEEAQEKRLRSEAANAAVLPMKWHKFLIYVSLPLSLILSVVGLVSNWSELTGTDFSRVDPQAAPYLRAALYLILAAQVIVLPVIVFTEYNLIKMRWRGVKALLFLYAFQFVYAALTVYLLYRAGASVPLDETLTIAEEAAMFFLNRLYYRKRRPLFSAP